MRFKTGNMFKESKANTFAVSTNGVIKKDGRLVMGAGAALSALCAFPDADRELGDYISSYHVLDPVQNSYIYLVATASSGRLIALQTKTHFRKRSDPLLLSVSLKEFAKIAYERHQLIAMNMPGVGYGGLRQDLVVSLLKTYLGHLNNIEVWQLP